MFKFSETSQLNCAAELSLRSCIVCFLFGDPHRHCDHHQSFAGIVINTVHDHDEDAYF